MSWEQISRYVYSNHTLLVDLREKEDFRKGHVTGAWNIPYEELEEHIREMSGYERIIFYCTHGNHSLAAARQLAKLGHQAYSIAGGYAAKAKTLDGWKHSNV
ncbi:MAG: rhodanese-like domain-containing protein [Lachnospiraceae bacterium]|nr:rhodanese-like domain-containing protein [Lachnospiraceae bacterium]